MLYNVSMKLTKTQKQQLDKIGKKFGLTLVLLFGSQMSGKKFNQESDLDVAVINSRSESYRQFLSLYPAFSKIFKDDDVDLRFIKDSDPVFFYQVFKNSQLLYGNPQDYYNYKSFAYKNYIDSRPLFQLKNKLILERQKLLNQEIKWSTKNLLKIK